MFSPLDYDYKAFSPEASLLHFLGISEEEQTTANTGPLEAEMTATETRTVESVVPSLASAVTESVITSSPVQSALPISTPQQELPILSHHEVSQTLSHVPSSGMPSPVFPGMSQAGVVSQLTALLQSIVGVTPTLCSSLGASPLCPPLPVMQSTAVQEEVSSKGMEQDLPAGLLTQDLSAAAETQGPSTAIEETTDVVDEVKDKETQAESDLEEEDGDLNSPAYHPTPIQRSDKDRESPLPSSRDEDVL